MKSRTLLFHRCWMKAALSSLPALMLHFHFQVPAAAQPSSAEPPSFTLSAIKIGNAKVPPLYYNGFAIDENGKKKAHFLPLPVGVGSRGPSVEIPLQPSVRLYTGKISPENQAEMNPVFTVPVKSARERMLLVFYQDEALKEHHAFIDDSSAAHPAESVRFVNLASRRVTFSVGGAGLTVTHGEEKVAEPALDDSGRFPFFCESEEVFGHPSRSEANRLRLVSKKHRLLVLYAPISLEVPTDRLGPDGNPLMEIRHEPQACRFYDLAEELPKATVRSQSTTNIKAPQ